MQRATPRLCAPSQPVFPTALLHRYSRRALTNARQAQKRPCSLHSSTPSCQPGLHIPSAMAALSQLSLQSCPTAPSKPDPSPWPIIKLFKDSTPQRSIHFEFISNFQQPQAEETDIYMIHDNFPPPSFWRLPCLALKASCRGFQPFSNTDLKLSQPTHSEFRTATTGSGSSSLPFRVPPKAVRRPPRAAGHRSNAALSEAGPPCPPALTEDSLEDHVSQKETDLTSSRTVNARAHRPEVKRCASGQTGPMRNLLYVLPKVPDNGHLSLLTAYVGIF